MDRNSVTQKYPACVGAEEAAAIFGWTEYYMAFLVRAGHLKPLGKPAQNSRKWFATVELERLKTDVEWLDKAIRIVGSAFRERHPAAQGPVLATDFCLQPPATI